MEAPSNEKNDRDSSGDCMDEILQCISLLNKAEKRRSVEAEIDHQLGRPFNIFNILRSPYDEVGLHSAFLAELLNPNGSHCQDSQYLKVFLEILANTNSAVNQVNPDTCRVYREKNNIDIMIRDNNNNTIIIENKIEAIDQDKQIERYYEYANKGGIVCSIVYLTPTSRLSAPSSRGYLQADQIDHLTYDNDIHNWIVRCIEITSGLSNIVEVLKQYLQIVKTISGKNMNQDTIEFIKKYLMKATEFQSAMLVEAALYEIKLDHQIAFWERLIDKDKGLLACCLNSGFTHPELLSLEGQADYTPNRVKKYYKGENGGQHIGCSVKICDAGNFELALRIQNSGEVFCGFHIVKDGEWQNVDDAINTSVSKILDNLFETTSSRDFLAWLPMHEDCKPDFWNFRHVPDDASLMVHDGSEQADKLLRDISEKLKPLHELLKKESVIA